MARPTLESIVNSIDAVRWRVTLKVGWFGDVIATCEKADNGETLVPQLRTAVLKKLVRRKRIAGDRVRVYLPAKRM